MTEEVLTPIGMTESWTRQERLNALASFLPVFSDPAFKFGQWRGGEMTGDAVIMPWFELSPDALRFIKAIYDYGYILDFNWNDWWWRSAEGQALRSDPDALAEATEVQLAKMLTTLARADRFAEGVLVEAFDSGMLTSILKRTDAIAKSGIIST